MAVVHVIGATLVCSSGGHVVKVHLDGTTWFKVDMSGIGWMVAPFIDIIQIVLGDDSSTKLLSNFKC